MLETFLPSLDPTYLAVLASVFLIAGIVKGFLGIGFPAAAMALLTLFLPPTEAIPLLWVSILATNTLQFARAPEKWEIARTYVVFAVMIALFIFVTAMFIPDYPTAILTVCIGVAMVIFSLNLLLGIKLNIGPGKGWHVGFGAVAGILGGVSSIWSPPVAMYLVARNVSKEHFIGATGFLFLAGCLPLGAGQVIAGILTVPVFLKSLILLGVVLAGFRIGEILRTRVSQKYFRLAVLIAFLIMGVRLIVIGVI